MRAQVVYESMFGNTAAVAEAIATGLRSRFEVTVLPVTEAVNHPAPQVDLLVVGGPTHAFGLSRTATRQDAAGQTDDPVEIEIGIREWLDAALPVPSPRSAAAFGTKIAHPPWLPGSAAKGIAKRLRHLGYHLVAAPADFLVEDMTGPLRSGELERATAWAARLAATRSILPDTR
ncbi:flavodoxin family protein [Nocardia neocaledoniensis]|uniref:flavodoxin family protein n=1 Tax=Nocardia neocaledoniensis TaxID=236511 RepID=UPI002457D5E2|nr:flavodoxin domain-containing protein [Nocardia neocaledoniensis]